MNDGRAHARLCAEIKREVSQIVEFEARDPILRDAIPTVMAVKLSVDARYAKVYVALAQGTREEKLEVMAAFRRDRGFFRTELARRLSLRYTPQLEFILDETVERAIRFEQILSREDDELGLV
ncbi:MAG TPA: 30S ribosome-binding factor RbfA [Candidatus Acetothermia bacterium]|nr:30S ribosome-binding factor RbfA [Candidatus Bipolaricaulota bacterium]HDJ30339.1 30S ribosome-binding factor RbfA [Candidatus Acetothermia bacterium]